MFAYRYFAPRFFAPRYFADKFSAGGAASGEGLVTPLYPYTPIGKSYWRPQG